MQVILLQAAAKRNRRDLDERLEEARKKDRLSPSEELSETYGKPMTQMTSDEIIMLASGSKGPKIIKTRKDGDNGEQQESQGEGCD